MVISFKDQSLESQLKRRSREQALSPSLLARRDLQRYLWLLAEHEPLGLQPNEFQAICSIVKAIKWFDEPSQIKKMPLMLEDCIRSTTQSATGQYSKVTRFGIDVDALCAKLRSATTLQLLGLLDRAEQFPIESLD